VYKKIRPSVAALDTTSGNCDYGTWRSLNRLRTGVGRCGVNMVRWGYGSDDRWFCGFLQTRDDSLKCEQIPAKCDRSDLVDATSKAIAVVQENLEASKFQIV